MLILINKYKINLQILEYGDSIIKQKIQFIIIIQ
jgi:hypothetical protein